MSLHRPEQKISRFKKNKEWYKKNIDSAVFMTRSDSSYLNTWRNQLENYNLSLGVLDERTIMMQLDPSNVGLEAFPVKPRHIGIGNSKLNILLGDYLSRKFEFRVSISNRDEEGISSKEQNLKTQLFKKLNDLVNQALQSGAITEEYFQKEVEKIQSWMKYDFQDIREMVMNQLLKHYYLKDDLQLKFTQGFLSFLVMGKVVYWIDNFGGKPDIRRLHPLSVTTVGGSTPYIHEKDLIIVQVYKSIGQIYDDYYDELKEPDRKKLEEWRADFLPNDNLSFRHEDRIYDNTSIFDVVPYDNYDIEHMAPPVKFSDLSGYGSVIGRTMRTTQNEILCVTVFWKSRRKIGKLEYIDELGLPQIDFVSEGYEPDAFKGEKVTWLWVNEWCEGTRIGEDIYVNMAPVKASSKSLTNLSSGIPPIIGLEVDRSVYDSIKELDISYDVTYFKRAMLIATYQGTKTVINQSMLPEGIDPKLWLHMSNIDQILLLDPTKEVLKGPATGKTAGSVLNTFITQQVELGSNHEAIQMMTNQLADLEYTMGVICGIPKERMGDVGERQAVRNTQFEIQQFQKATEYVFRLEENCRRMVFKKFVEVLKVFHRENPIAGTYFLSDMAQEFLYTTDEIAECEYDIHISNSSEDTKLFGRLEQAVDAQIAQGSTSISTILTLSSSGSLQQIAKKLEEKEMQEHQQQIELQKQKNAAALKLKEMEFAENQKQRDHEMDMLEKELEVKILDIEISNSDTGENVDLIDDTKTDLVDLALREKQINETIRHNKVTENETKRSNIMKEKISRIQKRKASSTK
jgi:hypothetical protein